MKKIAITLTLMACTITTFAQAFFGEHPKLVVGVVVDQMRWDYLSRYYDSLENDGFKRLIQQGYSCNNCLINYIPTVTAIGHASIYTGSTPAFHGICGNNFCIDGRRTYCTQATFHEARNLHATCWQTLLATSCACTTTSVRVS